MSKNKTNKTVLPSGNAITRLTDAEINESSILWAQLDELREFKSKTMDLLGIKENSDIIKNKDLMVYVDRYSIIL